MNNISDKDIIFDFECEQPLAFSYFGWEFNDSHAFYNYLVGYKAAADATYEAFIKADLSGDNEVTDTICYPLLFLYRHIIELVLKYSYIELKPKRTAEEIKTFLKNGHNIEKLWENARPDFERLSCRLGIDVDTSAIGHYIIELSKSDRNSMSYRYPIEKKEQKRFHNKGKYLDVRRLKERMDVFYNYMSEKIYELSKHLEDDIYDAEFDIQFCSILNGSKVKVRNAVEKIRKNIEDNQKKHNEKHWLTLSDIDNTHTERNNIHIWISTFSEQEKSIILLLFYTGQQIPGNRLALDTNERHKDVIKLLWGNSSDIFGLNSPKSHEKDEAFEAHIAYGGKNSLECIKRTLDNLGIDV